MRAAQNAVQPAAASGRTILDSPAIARVIDRIAHEIIERAGDEHLGELTLLGIPTRGGPLASRLAQRIGLFVDRSADPIPVGSVDITLYRDDLRSRGVRPLSPTCIPDGGIEGRHVVLVDDVLYSGRTVRAALDALREVGRPRVVQLAVLVDRGHRELPIRADYVGKNVPTSAREQVRVSLVETDGIDEVVVR
ncbi:MAG: bifunctional pyr operon transcriptional regulator/uracil phosphoribosyltransferase PyrR [Actinomycetota bacterium]|jgi:pyrimidine operon attenuation protein/uracil phosphoribosyltransferase|nr:bifunctional pyr operon transcriptional regulator/uracil phosphoribosyltransferase PyrR [Geodermatophilaceae bacterium]MDQ3053508.1 bifunctional pyr operon transcriptional regulator/uracil phosphoribosyltransferase PyrR [Actinomycetota bacterium]